MHYCHSQIINVTHVQYVYKSIVSGREMSQCNFTNFECKVKPMCTRSDYCVHYRCSLIHTMDRLDFGCDFFLCLAGTSEFYIGRNMAVTGICTVRGEISDQIWQGIEIWLRWSCLGPKHSILVWRGAHSTPQLSKEESKHFFVHGHSAACFLDQLVMSICSLNLGLSCPTFTP